MLRIVQENMKGKRKLFFRWIIVALGTIVLILLAVAFYLTRATPLLIIGSLGVLATVLLLIYGVRWVYFEGFVDGFRNGKVKRDK